MWYALQVQGGNEQNTKIMCCELIDHELLEQCFIPRYEKLIKYKGRWDKKYEILFPGYLFIETQCINRVFEALKTVPKYTKILCTDKEFVPISQDEQMLLCKLMNDEHIVEMSQGYMVGDNVIVTQGPMSEYVGCIKKIDRHKRLADIEVNMFGRIVSMKIGLEVVKKISLQYT